MPLNTQIQRNGQALPIHWGSFHVAAMVLAATFDSGQGPYEDNRPESIIGEKYRPGDPIGIPRNIAFQLTSYGVIATTPLNDGDYTLKAGYVFADATDGEVFELKPGDILSAWRAPK
jgi:hypothetical protein